MKILILKPSSLGDVIQSLPVLRLLKRHLPSAEIYWWIETGLAPLLEGDPDLTGTVLFHRRRWASPLRWGELWHSAQSVRARQFDWVIDLQALARSAVFAWLTKGRLTIGLDSTREGARGFYDIAVPRRSFDTHAVDWYLDVVRRLGVPVDDQFEWLRPRPEVARGVREKWPDTAGARWVAVQPGARWINKRWPIEYYERVLRELASRDSRLRFVILGTKQDASLGQALTRLGPQCLDLTGQTSLPEMIEWIRRCDLMISNDTGPMHVAAALRKPLIALFGPTEPRRTGPYGNLGNVLQLELRCSPCLRPRCRNAIPLECLRSLSPDMVLNAARRLGF